VHVVTPARPARPAAARPPATHDHHGQTGRRGVAGGRAQVADDQACAATRAERHSRPFPGTAERPVRRRQTRREPAAHRDKRRISGDTTAATRYSVGRKSTSDRSTRSSVRPTRTPTVRSMSRRRVFVPVTNRWRAEIRPEREYSPVAGRGKITATLATASGQDLPSAARSDSCASAARARCACPRWRVRRGSAPAPEPCRHHPAEQPLPPQPSQTSQVGRDDRGALARASASDTTTRRSPVSDRGTPAHHVVASASGGAPRTVRCPPAGSHRQYPFITQPPPLGCGRQTCRPEESLRCVTDRTPVRAGRTPVSTRESGALVHFTSPAAHACPRTVNSPSENRSAIQRTSHLRSLGQTVSSVRLLLGIHRHCRSTGTSDSAHRRPGRARGRRHPRWTDSEVRTNLMTHYEVRT
jgi:hypothetical protein